MARRSGSVIALLALIATAAPASGNAVPEAAAPSSLSEGCTPEGPIHPMPLAGALRPCGVPVGPEGTTTVAPVSGRLLAGDEAADAGEGWTRLVRPAPERRINVAMAYLPALGGVVMYGGLVCPGIDCNPVNETWLWDGDAWRRLQPATSPPALQGAAMTYDPARRELLLFGGETCSPTDCSFSSETWTFDGTTWEKHEVLLGPPASFASAIAYDASSSRVLLSGGCAQDRCPGLVGTWSWDGAAWQLEDVLTPLPRAGASMATNPGGGVVLFGGADARGGSLGETWVWNGEWAQRQPATSPPPRMYAGSTFDPDANRMVVFAGSSVTCTPTTCTGGYVKDTWTWDGTTWTERTSAPRGGQGVAIAYDSARQKVVRFGGISTFNNFAGTPVGAYESSTWLWDGQAWDERRSPMPEERTHAAMGFHPETGLLVLTGGNCLYTTTCDTWTWDGQGWTRIDAPAPRPNFRSSLIPDQATGSLLMPLANAVWSLEYDEEEKLWSWLEHPNSASPGGNGATIGGDRHNRVIEFGAQVCDASCTYADKTWRWDRAPWEEVALTGRPPGRAFGMMTFEPKSEKTFLFGGLTNGGAQYFKDTWTWDGEAWTEVAAQGPPDRAFGRIAADPETGEIMVLGGISGAPQHPMLADQWLFDGTAWRQVTAGGPVRRIEYALAADPARSNIVLFGGQDANPGRPMSDTWIWSG